MEGITDGTGGRGGEREGWQVVVRSKRGLLKFRTRDARCRDKYHVGSDADEMFRELEPGGMITNFT